MPTYRSFTKGVIRTMKKIDRQAKQAERRRVAFEKAAQRRDALEQAADAANEWNALLAELTGAHRVALRPHDWDLQAAAMGSAPPKRSDAAERQARAVLEDYRPGLLDRALGRGPSKRLALELAVEEARQTDDRAHTQALRSHEAALHDAEFAARVLAREPDAMIEALETFANLGDLPFCVEGVDVVITEDGRFAVMVDGLDLEDMPDRSVTLLQSGKASVKAMTPKRVQELHRENIASSALRVALEVLAALPLDVVEIVMHVDVLDRATGCIASHPVLWLRAARQALSSMEPTRIDPVAAVERLGGDWSWSAKGGFNPITLGSRGLPDRVSNV